MASAFFCVKRNAWSFVYNLLGLFNKRQWEGRNLGLELINSFKEEAD